MTERWWLSFSSGTCLGVAIVEVPGGGLTAALRKSHKLGINPGGEVQAIRMPIGESDDETVKLGLNRLIPREELIAAGYEPTRLSSRPPVRESETR